MSRPPPRQPAETAFPLAFDDAHQLCMMHHDVLLDLLMAGENGDSFFHTIQGVPESGIAALESEHVFDWLRREDREGDLADILRRVVFPAVLSDFLHFVFEAFETARKGKLTVAYALLRKPIQDNLFVLESLAKDHWDFARTIADHPERLDSKKAGGLDAHARRVAEVLNSMGEEARFDAQYLAELRFSKSAHDSFEGICNKALHLFTGHEAIKTEPLNINFVFSDEESHLTQWGFLYYRMPYVLHYARLLIEHLFAKFEARTDPAYLHDVERRIAAGTVLWGREMDDAYRSGPLNTFLQQTEAWLDNETQAQRFGRLSDAALARLRDTGRVSRVRRRLRAAVLRRASALLAGVTGDAPSQK